jgi:hypothetical protein
MWIRGCWLQLAKRDENPRVVENGMARSGEIVQSSGAVEAGELADPGRAYLSE